MAAEYIAASAASEIVIVMRNILAELGCKEQEATPLYGDNSACCAVAQDSLAKSKHVEIHVHWLQDLIARNRIKMIKCTSKEQLADILTKPLCPTLFKELSAQIG